ncbi:MAG: outer membrane beta-barrel protein [Pseudomonadota bacterium]
MKRTFLALSLSLASAGVFAQAAQFEGVSVGLGVASVKAETSVSDSLGGSEKPSKSNVIPSFDLAYTHAPSQKFLLTVGATYDFAKTKSGDFPHRGETASLEIGAHYSLYLQPSYLVSDNTALFVKVAQHSIKGTWKTPLLGEKSVQYDALGYGFGVKSFLNKNLFIQAEAQFVDFKDKTFSYASGYTGKYKPQLSAGILTLGYKF